MCCCSSQETFILLPTSVYTVHTSYEVFGQTWKHGAVSAKNPCLVIWDISKHVPPILFSGFWYVASFTQNQQKCPYAEVAWFRTPVFFSAYSNVSIISTADRKMHQQSFSGVIKYITPNFIFRAPGYNKWLHKYWIGKFSQYSKLGGKDRGENSEKKISDCHEISKTRLERDQQNIRAKTWTRAIAVKTTEPCRRQRD